MRTQKTFKVDEKLEITVRELTPKVIRQIYSTVDKLNGIGIKELMTTRLDALLSGLGDCVTLPKGVSLDDCGISTLLKIWEEFKVVNPDFLPLIDKLTASQLVKLSDKLTPTPATLQSADTSTSGTTDSPTTPDAVS